MPPRTAGPENCRAIPPNLRLRRRALLALPAGFVAGAARAQQPAASPPPDRRFRVLVDGTPIGTHAVTFRREGALLLASTRISLAVRIGPITVFRFEQEAEETWSGGTFRRIESRTNDDGTAQWVRAARAGNELLVEGSAGRYTAPTGWLPSTWWNKAVLDSPMFSAQDGSPHETQVTPGPLEEIPGSGGKLLARRHDVRGTLDLAVWYDRNGTWAGLRFRRVGAWVTYDPA
jgi:hypothetical protein